MTDYPRDRIVKSLQSLDWQETTEETEWHDRQVALVAVPVRLDHRIPEWTYEYTLLYMACGQDQNGEYCDVICDGSGWGGELNDIAWYVEVCDD